MSSQPAPEKGTASRHPLLSLPPEDLDLMLQFVLVSGSLKELASIYQVSYPTIRARVDRMIVRLRQAMSGEPSDPMGQLLADLVERGEITTAAAQAVRSLYRQREKLDS
jgi:hypothetical protein